MKPKKTVIAILLAPIVFLTLLVAFFVAARALLRPGVPERTVLELDLELPIIEDLPDNVVARVVLSDRVILRHLVDALHRAAEDERVEAVVARVGSGSIGFAATQELRAAVARFRASGKPAIAWAETFGEFGPGNGGYYLATAFDEIMLQPSGDVGLTGLSVDAEFYRGVFDKYDVGVHMDQRHEYKNAMNVYTETSFTDAHRESLDSILESLFTRLVQDVANARGLSTAEVRALVDRAPILGPDALDAGLVDELAYRDEVFDAVESRLGEGASFLSLDEYRSAAGSAYASGPRIALIVGDGNVVRGESTGGVDGSTTMGADTIILGFQLAIDDPTVEAIVFRVNSPGGSYVASDAIRREVVRAREAGKPVVVTMGNYAASGGYFVAMNADRIVAQPGTLTGSIGVLGGKLTIGGFFERFGVSYDNVHQGQNARMWSMVEPYDDAEWARLQAWLDRVYEDFTTRAAEGRGMPIDSLRAVARGRVWTGEQAYAIGLVDTLGGYDVALDLARAEAGLAPGAPVRVERYPSASSFLDLVLERGVVRGARDVRSLPGIGGDVETLLVEPILRELFARAGVVPAAPLPTAVPLSAPLTSPDVELLRPSLSDR